MNFFDWFRNHKTVACLLGGLSLAVAAGCGPQDDDQRDIPEQPSETEPAKIEGSVTLKGASNASGVDVSAGSVSTTTPSDGSFTLAGLEPGEVTLTARKDGWEAHNETVTLKGGQSKSVTITLDRSNLAPTVDGLSVTPDEMKPGATAQIAVNASDPNGGKLSYEYKATGGFAVQKSEDQPAQATLTAPDSSGTAGRVTVTVTDGNGESAEASVSVSTTGNAGPVIQDLRATPTDVKPGGTASLTAVANDPDGEKLSYKWTTPDGWSLNRDDALQVRLTAPETFDTEANIEVTVTDPAGASDSATITVATTGNQGPVIRSVSATPPQAEPGGTLQLRVDAEDPEGKPLSYSWTAPNMNWSVASPTKPATQVTAPDAYGETATLQVEVTDSEGMKTTGNVVISTPGNNGPRLLNLSATPQTVKRGGTVTATISASDPNGDDLSYEWSASGNWTATKGMDPTEATIAAPNTPGATGVITVIVKDGHGGQAKASTTVSTAPNQAPVISSLVASSTTLDKAETAKLSVVANDPDADALNYTWNVPSGWTKAGSGSQIDVTAPDKYGKSAVITVTVDDGVGGKVTEQVLLNTIKNDKPSIRALLVSKTTLKRNASVQAEVVASDPNGDSLSYSWSVRGGNGWSVTKNSNTDTKATVKAPNVPEDQTVLEVTVTDEAGASVSTTKTFETMPNHAPKLTSPAGDLLIGDSDNPSPISPTRHWAFQLEAKDADGDALTYSLPKSPKGAKVDQNGLVTWQPTDKDAGTHTFQVKVSDGFDSVTRKLEIRVASYFLMKATKLWDAGLYDGTAWADFDGDGILDAVTVAERGGSSADIAVNIGTKDGFKKEKRYTWDNNAQYCAAPAVGDVDGNRTIDVVIVCDRGKSNDDDDASWYVWLNDGTGSFKQGPHHYWNEGDFHWVSDVELGDLDQDGDLDLAATGDEHALIAENDGKGNFNNYDEQHYSNCWSMYSVEIAEFRGGGRPEVAFGAEEHCGSDRGELRIYQVDRNVHFTGRIYRDTMGHGRERPYGLKAHDLDGDKDMDLVLLDDDSDRVRIYRNDKGNMNHVVDTSLGHSPANYRRSNNISFGDLDNDGNVDMVFGTDKNRNIRIFFGDGKAGVRQKHWVTLDTRFDNMDIHNVHVAKWNADNSDDVFFTTHNGKLGVAH